MSRSVRDAGIAMHRMTVSGPRGRLRRAAGVAALLGAAVMLAGCGGPGGALTIRSTELGNDAMLAGDFDTAVYAASGQQRLDLVLLAGPAESPRRAMHVRMFWKPMAGATPFDPSATNTTVRLMVFEGEEAGVYAGGGLLRPRSKVGKEQFKATLRNATLRLLDATEAYRDPLGAAVAAGDITARRHDERTEELLRQLARHLEQRFGYPVMAGADSAMQR